MVAMRFHWTIEQIGLLYFDNSDYKGLFFWVEKVQEEAKEYNKK